MTLDAMYVLPAPARQAGKTRTQPDEGRMQKLTDPP